MSLLARAAALLNGVRAPVLLLGPAARGAQVEIELLRARLGAAILTTPEAKSLVDERLPESAGVFSFGSSAYANALVDAADAVVALGSELGEFASRGGRAFAGKLVIQLLDDARDVATTLTPELALVGEIGALASALAARIEAPPSASPWFEAIRARAPVPAGSAGAEAAGSIGPSGAIAAVAAALPARARIACDVSSAALMLLRDVRLGAEQRLWCNIEKSACMGGALAAGVGLRLASELPTLVLIGDWGLMMGSSELHTAASLGLSNFAVVVWSNAGGALIRDGVRALGIDVSSETYGFRRPARFAQVARGYGLRGVTVRSALGLARVLSRALRGGEPTLIDAIIDPEAPVPAGDRYLHLDAGSAGGPR